MRLDTPDDFHRESARRLEAVLAKVGVAGVSDYTDVLIGCEQALGADILLQEERLLASAMACDTCIQSGGLVSCFEHASPHILRGEAAMNLIALPAHAQILRRVVDTSDLGEAVTPEALKAVFFARSGDDWDNWIERLAPLEAAYDELGLGTVTAAVLAFIQEHHGTLRRPSL